MFQPITPAEDAVMAGIIRQTLRAYRLDLPGTAYFDASLDGLSACYAAPNSGYWVLHVDGRPVGGGGFAAFSGFSDCCELQKLYLAASERGKGIGYELISHIEDKARELGYQRIYLETHTNLPAAIHIYEKSGFRKIERPAGVVHAAMNRFYLKEL
jgi:putative acetyltransferase